MVKPVNKSNMATPVGSNHKTNSNTSANQTRQQHPISAIDTNIESASFRFFWTRFKLHAPGRTQRPAPATMMHPSSSDTQLQDSYGLYRQFTTQGEQALGQMLSYFVERHRIETVYSDSLEKLAKKAAMVGSA
ncbi:hypothetical protein BASA83_012383 [Batrachochytrium salamandrivorans]|nr:hypothetical protein BASA83_012383 [Batrachochytrium salamandrivorans]